MDQHIDLTDPPLFLKLGEHSWKASFYGTRIAIDAISDKHAHDPVPDDVETLIREWKKLRASKEPDADRIAELEAELDALDWGRDPRRKQKDAAFYEDVRKFLAESAGLPADKVTLGDAQCFIDRFFGQWSRARDVIRRDAWRPDAMPSSPPSTTPESSD